LLLKQSLNKMPGLLHASCNFFSIAFSHELLL
jgi:hypothetical protein